MHPLLARGERLALYLALWIIVGALLASLLAGEGGLTHRAAAVVAFPLVARLRFVCLSAWYVARSTPIATSGLPRLLSTALGAAAPQQRRVGAAGPLAGTACSARCGACGLPFGEIAADLLRFRRACFTCSRSPSATSLSAFEHARDGRAPGAAGAGALEGSGAALAAGADRSAFPVQQPALDQRA